MRHWLTEEMEGINELASGPGDIILTGVGKDATSLFEGIGHSSFARKKLRTFQIGEVSER